MMAALCPEGATSTVYALLTSVQMAGSTLAGSLSSALTHALGVRLGDYSNLGALTLMTAAIRLCTLLCVGLVPAKTTRALQAETAVSGRLLRSVGSSDKEDSVESTVAADPRGSTHGHEPTVTTTTSRQQKAFGFVQLEDDGPSAPNSSEASRSRASVATTPTHAQAGLRRRPYGAVLLFSMIAGSLIWSLVSMFSHL